MKTFINIDRNKMRLSLALASVMLIAAPVSAATPAETAKLLAEDGAAGDAFGFSVALSGDTALIGAIFHDDKGEDAGAAYIFTRTGTTWRQQAKLTAADGVANETFGGSVALSGDTAVIGAILDDEKGEDAGAAYVFMRSGTYWRQQAKLTAEDAAPGAWFGYNPAISSDTILIGAAHDDDNGDNSGSAYVFVREGIKWRQQAKLTAGDGAAGDIFGVSGALAGDTAVIGADRDGDKGVDSGSAYVFTRTGTNWRQQAKLTAADGAAGDIFGVRVALSGDSVLIGARRGDGGGGAQSGTAYMFTRSGDVWSEQAKLIAEDGAAGDLFGYAVALSGDTALIGANFDDDNGEDSGAAYVFTRAGGAWRQQAKLLAGDGAADDAFGWSVALSGDNALIGAAKDNDNSNDSGSVYVFDINRD